MSKVCVPDAEVTYAERGGEGQRFVYVVGSPKFSAKFV